VNDWQTILRDVYKSPVDLLQALNLSLSDFPELDLNPSFPLRVPQPFVDRMMPGQASDPLLKQVLSLGAENLELAGFSQDPLDEHLGPLPGLLHKYRSRVLLIFTGGCAINCRYCFRRHFPYQAQTLKRAGLDAVVEYLNFHPEVNEVILSGGDPLMADDTALRSVLSRLAKVPGIRRLRLHTRLPVVIPQRITDTLVDSISSVGIPVVCVLHINHAQELDARLQQSVAKLRAVCRSVLNQAVILRGVNDTAEDQIQLSERLFDAGIDPYYLNVLDRVQGASHFNVSDTTITSILAGMRNALPGFLVPRVVSEVAGMGHKVLWSEAPAS
jgi:EF-P beta-lysylation protein EpmB